MAGRVVVVGSGIAGLAAAWQLHQDSVEFRVIEAESTVGGKIRTSEFAGRMVDEAADAFLARVPQGIDLAHELGLAGQLIEPTARKAQVWAGGLARLPEPNVLGLPLDPNAAAELLGPEAGAAVSADAARTEPDPVRHDDTIGSLVRRRVGDVVHEALVDPLIGAINAGDTDVLSLAAASPQILAAAQAGPSLTGALAAQAATRKSDAAVFHSFSGGMRTLVDALGDALGDRITTGVTVESLGPRPGGGATLELSTGEVIAADAVVLAVPSPVAARLSAAWPTAAAALAAVPMVSVTLVALAYPAGTVGQPGDLSGFVVPRNDLALTITACSYASTKWAHLGGDHDLLRVSVGHAGDQVTPDLDEAELLDIVAADLNTALGITVEPTAHRISRWPDAFPQYLVGHLDRLAAAEQQLHPAGVFLAGMSYRGIGIPANIDQGRRAARAAQATLAADSIR